MKRLVVLTLFAAMVLFLAPQAFADSGHHSHNHVVKAPAPFDASEKAGPHCPLKHNIKSPKDCPHSMRQYRNPGIFLVADCHGGNSEGPLSSSPQLKNLNTGYIETMEPSFHAVSRISTYSKSLASLYENVPTPPPLSA